MEPIYRVKRVENPHDIEARVVGSKSITNRALLLAAMTDGPVQLNNVLFSEDSRVFMQAMVDLGFETSIDEPARVVKIKGCNGMVPAYRRNVSDSKDEITASVYVGSAGTAARFLTAFLGLSEGKYRVDASEQMKKRPMKELLVALEELGSVIVYEGEPYHFPFVIGMGEMQAKEVSINIDKSSQFLSALLIIAPLLREDLQICIEGSHGMSYVDMTLAMMEQFGADVPKIGSDSVIDIPMGVSYHRTEYDIEPDLSAACYFYAMGAILGVKSQVKGVYQDSLQGDLAFLSVLEKMGCTAKPQADGILLKPSKDGLLGGSFDLSSFSDQALTLAAIAPFAKTPVAIRNVAHIRLQECDRIEAIIFNLNRLGIDASEENGTITIHPGKVHGNRIETYSDHRVAMSFTLCGLLSEDPVVISNPMCCKKTFETYFDCLEAFVY